MTINILDNIDLQRLGELLRQARKQRGMTQENAAKAIDASRTTMVAIEKGTRRLKAAELIKLARAYGRSVSDFVRQRPVIDVDFSKVQFRGPLGRTEEEKNKIEPYLLHLEELCKNYLELAKKMNSHLPQNYPAEYDATHGMPLETLAEAIAGKERQRLGLGDSPIRLLRDILEEDVGLRIFYLKMPSKYSEIYIYIDQSLGGCFGINADHPEERRRWSLAHGYLHFLAHRRKFIVDFEGQYKKTPESEQLADAFAKYFLMPTSSLLKKFEDRCRANDGKFTPVSLFTLAHYYGVSVEALARRLEEMKLLPSGTWNSLKDRGLKVRKVQKELNLEDIPQRPDLTPIHYQHLAIDALDRGLITEGQFAKFLSVNRLEARRIAAVLQEYSSKIQEEAMDLNLRRSDNEKVGYGN